MKTKNLKYIFISLILLLIVFVSQLGFIGSSVRADTTIYTNVLDDLRKDSNFKESDYKQINTDYSVNVIQVAESAKEELIVYTYQPSGKNYDIKASKIKISSTTGENLEYKVYGLTFINSSGVFYKYKVNDFELSNEVVRYYDISSIYRPYSMLDSSSVSNNVVTQIAYPVNKLFTISGTENLTYSIIDTENVFITEKFVGTIRYTDGKKTDLISWIGEYTDSHFVAFSSDKDIDKLLEADVYFVSQRYTKSEIDIIDWWWDDGWLEIPLGEVSTDTEKENYVTLRYDEVVTTEKEGILGKSYKWNRIQTVEEFLKEDVASEEFEEDVKNLEWVLRFAETDYQTASGAFIDSWGGTRVSDVTILRLKFESDGQVYNLGVVDNFQHNENEPPVVGDSFEEVKENVDSFLKWLKDLVLKIINFFKNFTWKKFIIVVIIVLALIFLPIWFPLVKILFNLIFKGIIYILKLITWPFRALFSKKE